MNEKHSLELVIELYAFCQKENKIILVTQFFEERSFTIIVLYSHNIIITLRAAVLHALFDIFALLLLLWNFITLCA
jgi:hypothetical protein